jgi:hypothetical protein
MPRSSWPADNAEDFARLLLSIASSTKLSLRSLVPLIEKHGGLHQERLKEALDAIVLGSDQLHRAVTKAWPDAATAHKARIGKPRVRTRHAK